MINLSSAIRGIRAIELPYTKPKPKWGIHVLKGGWSPNRFWIDFWTPKWHCGRGPYLTVGLGLIAIYRGY